MLDPTPGKHELLKCRAMIRANYHIDPDKLSDEQFGMLAAEAMWVEEMRARLIVAEVSKLLEGN